MGLGAVASNVNSFAWYGQVSHGDGTFNIGAPSLLYLNGTSLQTLLDGKVATNDAAYLASLTNATFAAQDGITISGRTLNIGTNLLGGTGTPTAYTNLFTGSGTTGSVSSAAGDAGKYLKADGTWDEPAGEGGITASDATNIAQTVLATHTSDATEAHAQSAIDAVRTVTTIAVDQEAGTQTVALAWGEVLRCRILATNSGVVVKYDWPALPATNRTRFAALEHWNPNSRSVTFADTTYWSSNGIATTTALTLGKYAEVSIKGSTYYYAIRGLTNATELGAP
jgi:hypothetical protein